MKHVAIICLLLLPQPLFAFEDAITTALKAWEVPGVVVVIVRDDQVVYLKGHGRKHFDRDEPPTADTRFPLASCSKAFTTTLMAQLVDAGKMRWDDPVRRHLRGFRLDDPHVDALVTMRDLVTHRTGLATHDLLWYRAPWSVEEMVKRAGRLPIKQPFRSHFEYQSVMFSAAGLACAQIGGKPWHQLIQERLFDPLGMESSTCRPQSALKFDHADGHKRVDGKLEIVPWYAPEEPNAAGSIVVTGGDLVPWLRLQLNGGQLGDQRIVSEANFAETHTPQVALRIEGPAKELYPETIQLSYAMGWLVQDYRGRQLLSHGGVIDGFRANITLLPREKIGIAILNNLQATRMGQALSYTLVDEMLGLQKRDWNSHFLAIVKREETKRDERQKERDRLRRADQPPSLPLTAYLGTYHERAYGDAIVTLEKEHLVWSWSGFRVRLAHHHGDTFEFLDDPLLKGDIMEFRADGNGVVKSLRAVEMVFERK